MIDKENEKLDMYSWTNETKDLLELKAWVDTQLARGRKKVTLSLQWGYYDDISDLELIAE